MDQITRLRTSQAALIRALSEARAHFELLQRELEKQGYRDETLESLIGRMDAAIRKGQTT